MDKKRELALLMSEISEDCWFAEWMSGNEYSIWDAIQPGADRRYGLLSVYEEDADRLIKLADEVRAWPVWDDSVPREEEIDGLSLKWVPLDEWKRMFALQAAK